MAEMLAMVHQVVTVERADRLLVLMEAVATVETQAMAEMEVMQERRTAAL
jgi:hypothetical protein